jgi:hypothetical protein
MRQSKPHLGCCATEEKNIDKHRHRTTHEKDKEEKRKEKGR